MTTIRTVRTVRTALATAALVATLAVGLAALSACKSSEASCATAHQCLPAVTYEDLNHATYTAAELRGKVVVVNFWATWCGPCKREIPAFNKVYADYKDKGVIFLGVLHDNTVDDNGLLNFMSDNEFTYPVVKVTNDILSAYHFPSGLPTTFIYAASGKIIDEHRGELSEAVLRTKLDSALDPNKLH